MKKRIAILGSTGSIGKNLLEIINNDKKNFQIELLSTNKNYKELLRQAKLFKVKNLIVANKNCYELLKKKKLIERLKFSMILIRFRKYLKRKLITR